MKRLLLGLCSFLALAELRAQVVLVSTSFDSTANVTVAGAEIETSGTVNVPNGANVKFRGTARVTLKPGFAAASGSRFRAFIFVDTDGDGMDDAWEVTHGLNPSVNDAGGDRDGDQISNIVEYQLGTNANGGSTNTDDTGNTSALKVHRPHS